jgi:hypothetical protein
MWFADDDPRAPTGWHVVRWAQRITPMLSTAARALCTANSTALSRARGWHGDGAMAVMGSLSSRTGRP